METKVYDKNGNLVKIITKPAVSQPIKPSGNKFQDKFSLKDVEDLSYLKNVGIEKDLRNLGVGRKSGGKGSGSIAFPLSANQEAFCKIANALSYDKWTSLTTLKKKKICDENSVLSKLILSGLVEQNNKNQFKLSKENQLELEYLRDTYDPARKVRRSN